MQRQHPSCLSSTLIRRVDGRNRAYLIGATIRVSTHCGPGTLRYLTDDGFAGVALDGERNPRRTDEFAAVDCTVVASS